MLCILGNSYGLSSIPFYTYVLVQCPLRSSCLKSGTNYRCLATFVLHTSVCRVVHSRERIGDREREKPIQNMCAYGLQYSQNI